jgi:tetratricopeptide (TPR) repeat protein
MKLRSTISYHYYSFFCLFFRKGRKIDRRNFIEKIPFFALSVIFGIVAINAQQGVGATDITVFPFSQRIIFACYGFMVYLSKLILPIHLGAFYSYPVAVGESIPVIYYLVAIMLPLLICFIIYSIRFTRNIIFGIGFFAVTIFLVLQLLPVGSAIIADRYSYLPSIGIFFLAGIGFNELWKRKFSTPLKYSVATLLGIAVIFFSLKTYALCKTWKDGLTLWNSVISQNPNSPTAYSNRGIAFMNENQIEEAFKDFNRALELKPDYADVLINRGVLYARVSKFQEALNDFDKSIQYNPTISSTYNNKGYILRGLNRFDEALSSLNRAIELDPYNFDAYYNRALTLKSMNKYVEAIENFDKTIELNSSYLNAYFERGVCLMTINRIDEAMSDFSSTINLSPEFAQAYEYRSSLYLNGKNYNAALNDLNKLIELQPNSAIAFLNRGSLNGSMKKFPEAIADFNTAISIQPDLAKAYYNKAMIELSAGIKDSACIHLKQAGDFGFTKAMDLYKEACK